MYKMHVIEFHFSSLFIDGMIWEKKKKKTDEMNLYVEILQSFIFLPKYLKKNQDRFP